jgi:hypothetical protein
MEPDYKDGALRVIFFQYPLVSILDNAYPASSINQFIKGEGGGTPFHNHLGYTKNTLKPVLWLFLFGREAIRFFLDRFCKEFLYFSFLKFFCCQPACHFLPNFLSTCLPA